VNPTTCAISVAFVQKLSAADKQAPGRKKTDYSDTLFFSLPIRKLSFSGKVQIARSGAGRVQLRPAGEVTGA
jgi:hypothetical protein